MHIIVRLIGDGTAEHPYSAPLPTFSLVDIDYTARLAIVDVPDRDLPEDVVSPHRVPPGRRLRDIPSPRPLDHTDQRLKEHMRKRYGFDVMARFTG